MPIPLVTDLARVQELGEQRRAENHRFRRFLKVRRHSDRTLRHLAEGIEAQIDCRACANCCRLATTQVAERDIKRLASFLRRSAKDVIEQFTVESEDEGRILQRTEAGGCVFLDGNDCTVYDGRPDTCQRFPHLVRGNGSLVSRMWQFIDRAVYCPIVLNSLEAFKDAVGFKR
jgi:uncharacterized protein